jgi:hypothetical protein
MVTSDYQFLANLIANVLNKDLVVQFHDRNVELDASLYALSTTFCVTAFCAANS